MRAEDLASKPGNERNVNENLPLCPELTCLLRRRRDIDSDTKQVMSPEHATADL